ncbi:DUF7501 family protein [Natronomonas sp. EA1]|uniref:DUF7501 family protein n=1 Tax=Natronomonas sp. EA1 TaxID=3421655 RepID=UPI003EBF454F
MPQVLQRRPRWARVWDDPERCPFCGDPTADGGAGFIDHIESENRCARAFERWREGVREDIEGEWSG